MIVDQPFSLTMPDQDAPELTIDRLFSGKLVCLQHRDGYRFSVDAVLLAHFAQPRAGEKVLDLCAGCGVISLILKYRQPQLALAAFELQPKLAELIRKNVETNGFQDSFTVIEGDCNRMREYVTAGSFDRVVCNPPYRKAQSGRVNPTEEEARARHEVRVELSAVLSAIRYALKTRGRADLVYPARRAAGLLAAMKAADLEPKKIQVVYSYPDSEGKLVLVEAVKGGGEELAVLPPFYLYTEPHGACTPEMAALYQPLVKGSSV